MKNDMDGLREYSAGVDLFIEKLIIDYHRRKSFSRLCKTNICFNLKSQKPREYFTRKGEYTPKVKAALEKAHGDDLAVIYNEWFFEKGGIMDKIYTGKEIWDALIRQLMEQSNYYTTEELSSQDAIDHFVGEMIVLFTYVNDDDDECRFYGFLNDVRKTPIYKEIAGENNSLSCHNKLDDENRTWYVENLEGSEKLTKLDINEGLYRADLIEIVTGSLYRIQMMRVYLRLSRNAFILLEAGSLYRNQMMRVYRQELRDAVKRATEGFLTNLPEGSDK